MIRKLLIANRGEIAVRVIRAAREMGIRTVAVASDADAGSLHANLADEVVALGGSAPAESYLSIPKIIAACEATGSDAVHPGYGFLSERAEFSEACRSAGITFLGPSPEAMRLLGAKIDAKNLAVRCDVPIVPGFFEVGATALALKEAALQIGYPIMLKASAGGGGRGMRVVRDPQRFDDELATAMDEAKAAFGDDAMMVERLVDRPRHIEVQALGDRHGNVAILFERECSLQRRNQKLVEEAPMAGPFTHVWPAMRESARRLLAEAGYVGAGTVEFMLDPATGEFYFLEVNARLQVEHPVTEAITGIDLVQWQIRIANGESLPDWPTDRSRIHGHAIEARIVAEDPGRGFLPSLGKVLAWSEPKMPGVRVDSGFVSGSEVSQFYDSLMAKVIAHGATRDEARRRLIGALREFHILGVRTNIAYILDVLDSPGFASGDIDTGFLGREFGDWSPGPVAPELESLLRVGAESSISAEKPKHNRAWDATDGFRNAR